MIKDVSRKGMPSKVVIGGAEAQRLSPAQRREEENLVSRLRGNDIFSACSAVSAV